MSVTSFKGFAATLSADPDAGSLVDVLEAYGSQPMWRDTLLGVWHVERACPLVSATAGHLHPTVLSFANLPDRDLYCTRCSSHRAHELGRLVALLAPLLSHLGTFSS
jgi:hypothetical protein